jgi:hypothetical protein
MKNPFPGMNPYLEEHWRDVHTRLTIYISDQLQETLPAGLVARAEEQVSIDEDGQRLDFRPDVQLVEPSRVAASPVLSSAGPRSALTAVAEPLVVLIEPEVHRWVEIVDAGGRVVTVIEVLSPSNKADEGRGVYRRKQRAYISGGVNLVEIDLLRAGERVFSIPWSEIPDRARTSYMVCVFRATQPGQREIYPLPLRQPLPALRIPLRPTDADVALELQSLVDQCFERGRYWMLDYRRDLQPPLAPGEAQWLDQLLRKAGLR